MLFGAHVMHACVRIGNYPANYTVQEPVPDYGGEAHQPSPYQARTASSSTMYNSEGKGNRGAAQRMHLGCGI